MQKSDMHQAYIRSLMLLIGGIPRAGEMDAWLDRISKTTGIGFRSLRAAYYGQWISKYTYVSSKTLNKLEWAADDARQNRDTVEFLELQISIWETSANLYQPKIDMARNFVAWLRRYDAEGSRRSIPVRTVGTAAEAAGLSPAAAKA